MHIENQSSITYSHKKVRTYVRPWLTAKKRKKKKHISNGLKMISGWLILCYFKTVCKKKVSVFLTEKIINVLHLYAI